MRQRCETQSVISKQTTVLVCQMSTAIRAKYLSFTIVNATIDSSESFQFTGTHFETIER